MAESVNLFILFDAKDYNYLKALERQMEILKSQGIISIWSSDNIIAGSMVSDVTYTQLTNSSILVPLISADFLASKSCLEIQKAAFDQGKTIIPVLVRSCMWQVEPILKEIDLLPKDSGVVKPVSNWSNMDDAFTEVVSRIMERVYEQLKKPDQTRQNRIDKLQHMEGVYRVWTEVRHAGELYVLQSKMTIERNYRSRFWNHIVDNGKEQLCEIHFNQDSGKEKLIFIVRRITKEGAGDITSTAVMEFPRKDAMRGVLIGSYSSVGAGPGFPQSKKSKAPKSPLTEVRVGFFVAKLEKLDKDFEVDLIAARKFEDDPKYVEMLRILLVVNGRRNNKMK